MTPLRRCPKPRRQCPPDFAVWCRATNPDSPPQLRTARCPRTGSTTGFVPVRSPRATAQSASSRWSRTGRAFRTNRVEHRASILSPVFPERDTRPRDTIRPALAPLIEHHDSAERSQPTQEVRVRRPFPPQVNRFSQSPTCTPHQAVPHRTPDKQHDPYPRARTGSRARPPQQRF